MPREDLSFDGRKNLSEDDKRKDENKSGMERRKMERRRELCGKTGKTEGSWFTADHAMTITKEV